LKWGGAKKLEGSFLSGFFIHVLAINWDEEVIKFYAMLILLVSTIGFILGLFVPVVRHNFARVFYFRCMRRVPSARTHELNTLGR
jgi:hypothetical protein